MAPAADDSDKEWPFNLKDDPTKKNNLTIVMRDKVNEMKIALSAIDAEQAKPLWPALLEGPVRIGHRRGSPNEPDAE